MFKSQNSIWATIRAYKWQSVFFRYLRNSFLMVLVVFLPYNLLIFGYYDNVLKQEIITQSNINVLKSKDIFDLLIGDFHKNYALASQNSHVKQFLTMEGRQITRPSAVISNSTELLASMVDYSDSIEELYLYSFENSYCISSNVMRLFSEEKQDSWLRTYRATKLPFLMFPRKIGGERFNCIYLCSEIYDEQQHTIGLFCARINYESFADILQKSFEEEPQQLFIVSDIGLILFSYDQQKINTLVFEEASLYKTFESIKSSDAKTYFVDDYIVSAAKSTNSQLIMMSYVQKNTASQSASRGGIMLIGGGVAVLLISLLMACLLSYRMYRSVAVVLSTLKDPKRGTMQLKEDNLGEFLYITHEISNISNEKNSVANALSTNLEVLRKAQIAALQSQINPHFLFNTLQLIDFSIIKEVKADTTATKLISLLSELLRTSYDFEHYIIPIGEEIDNARKYLEIQKTKYKSHLHVIVDVADECFGYQTIKLILQPMIENCIVHGLSRKSDEWIIILRCYYEEGMIVFEISDNGIGISSDKIGELLSSKGVTSASDHNSIGVANVNERIKLVFGARYHLEITSILNEGTKITIRHPARKNLAG